MRKQIVPSVVALIVAAALVVISAASTPAAAVAAAGKPCKPKRDVLPTGVRVAWAVKIRATRTSCAFARRLPEKYILNARYGAFNPKFSKAALGIKGWSCEDHGGNGGWQAPVVCTADGGKRVSWRLADHP